MHSVNDKKGFKGMEEWDRRNTNLGGGRLLRVKGARYDDHSHVMREIMSKSNNPSSSMSGCSSSGASSSKKK